MKHYYDYPFNPSPFRPDTLTIMNGKVYLLEYRNSGIVIYRPLPPIPQNVQFEDNDIEFLDDADEFFAALEAEDNEFFFEEEFDDDFFEGFDWDDLGI